MMNTLQIRPFFLLSDLHNNGTQICTMVTHKYRYNRRGAIWFVSGLQTVGHNEERALQCRTIFIQLHFELTVIECNVMHSYLSLFLSSDFSSPPPSRRLALQRVVVHLLCSELCKMC